MASLPAAAPSLSRAPALAPRAAAPASSSSRRAAARRRAVARAAAPSPDLATDATTTTTTTTRRDAAKRALRYATEGTYRGALASTSDRAAVEEAQVALEAFAAGTPLDRAVLAGRWRLLYTTASDVLSVIRLGRDVGVVDVGDVFQSFDDAGKIQNEIRLSVPFLLAPATRGKPGGVSLKVDADYRVVGDRTLSLVFNEAKVSEVRISDAVEAALAPALLPRGSLNRQVLLAIREFELKFPLRSALSSMGGGGGSDGDGDGDGAVGGGNDDAETRDASAARGGGGGGAPVGAYLISYVDEDTLVGRANGTGTFIFQREGDFEAA